MNLGSEFLVKRGTKYKKSHPPSVDCMWCRSVTLSVETAQEFTVLHNFIDVFEVVAAFLCRQGCKTRPSATIFRETP